MKKIITVTILSVVLLFVFCSCNGNTPAEKETITLTYTDIFNANTHSAITSNHNSVKKNVTEIYLGEIYECEYYWDKTGFYFPASVKANDEENAVQDLSFISDNGSYLYLYPMMSEEPGCDIFTYYVDGGAVTEESSTIFGLLSPEYNQTITECKKTETGFEVTGDNCDSKLVSSYCPLFFTDKEYSEGDKILFKFVLNDKYEVMSYETYYVFADGTETVKVYSGELIYDNTDCPDYVTNVQSIIEKGAKDISVKIHTETEVIERTVYSEAFLLYTDYEVYSDADYSNLLTEEDGYYPFSTDDNINIYLKAPASAE